MTDDIIRLIPEDGLQGYIYIWLQTDYAKVLLRRFSYGAVIRHIEKEHLASVPIPLLKTGEVQRRINDLALEANEKRHEAYRLEQEALKVMNEKVIHSTPPEHQ